MMLNFAKIFSSHSLIFIQLIFTSICSIQIVLSQTDDDFKYNIGDLKLFCPSEPDDEWKLVGTDCFKKLPESNKFDWAEANMICRTEKNVPSELLHLKDFLLHKELSRQLNFDTKNGNGEFWTACQIGQMPDRIYRFGSNQSASIYNPIWAALEPQIALIDYSKAEKLCISWDAHFVDQNQFGWRLRNCSDLLPTICQTFPCYLDSNSQLQHRCSDNSRCISHLAICDGLADCANDEDESHCGDCPCDNNNQTNLTTMEYTAPFGIINANSLQRVPNVKEFLNSENFCAHQIWRIIQKPGARIKLNFLSLNLQADDEFQIVDEESGESTKILNNTGNTYSMLLASHNVKIIFTRATKTKQSRMLDSSNFKLQYFVDEASICHRRFESWNGSFSTPMRIPDNGLYKVPMDCHWTIENQARSIVAIKFIKFDLDQDDWLEILLDKNYQIGNFSSKSPPTALLVNAQKIEFLFKARKTSNAGRGFQVAFERACLNQLLNNPYGSIEIHNLMPLIESEIHCSWIIKVPCKNAPNENCPFTIFLDNLNATEDDKITFKTGDEDILPLDLAKKYISPFQFRSNSDTVKIRIQAVSENFSAKFVYSIDCPPPSNVKIVRLNEQKSTAAKKYFPFRSIVHFGCSSIIGGIEGGGIGKLICEKGGKWKLLEANGNGQTCFSDAEKKNKLTKSNNSSLTTCIVPIIENGFILALNRTKGQMTFSCQFGFEPLDPTNVYCMPIGKWVPEPKCEAIKCPNVPEEILPPSKFLFPIKLINQTRGSLFGSRAFYKCPEGSLQKGNHSFAECSENGTWNSPQISCLAQQCPYPSIKNGENLFFHNSEGFNFAGTNLSIFCRTKNNTLTSVLIGPMTIMECEKNGQWKGDGNLAKKCAKIISCQVPILPNSMTKIKGSKTEFGINEIVEFECENENESLMIGANKAICLINGKWSNGPPICIVKEKEHCQLAMPDVRALLLADKYKIGIGEKVTFHCAQPNYRLSDPSPRICVKAEKKDKMPMKIGRKKRQIENGEIRQNWQSLINAAIPFTEVAFDSAKNEGTNSWTASAHWSQLGNGRWSFRPLVGIKNFLISPVVEVSAKDWLDASIELSPIPCQNCLVWLSYYSTDTRLEGPPSSEHFTPLGGVLADPTVHSIQFSLEHPFLWLQISVDEQSPELKMERMKITITACPKLQLGSTLFPRTPVKSENHTVQGKCLNGGKEAMGLICSPLGKWFPANEEFVDLCKCSGQAGNGENCSGTGIQCHSCTSETSPNCLTTVPQEDFKFCAPNQICFVRTTSNGTGQMPFAILRGCANRMDCGIFQPNISIRESCKTSLEGIEICTACCSDPLCNNKLPSKLLLNKMPQSKISPIAPMLPKLSAIENEIQFSGEFDGLLPHCIDEQPLELECVDKIQIHQTTANTFEPTLIPWPKVIDNDPNFRLFPLNIPLTNPNQPIQLEDNLNEILWKAEDRHGFSKICSTKVEFLDASKKGGENEGNLNLNEAKNAQIECPDIFIHKVNTTTLINANLNSEGILLIPTEYPPIKFIAPQGSMADIKLSFDPPIGTLLEIGVPKLINVNAGVLPNGNCQFWYQSKAIDCPLQLLGPEWDQFECAQSDPMTKICIRRTPCQSGIEFPANLRELRCRMNQSKWTYLAGTSEEEHELLGDPICLQEMSSTISLSMELLPIGPSDSVNCMRHLAQRIRPHLAQFLENKCPQVHWIIQSHSIKTQSFVQNFSTTDYKSNRDVLLCIELLTNELSKSLPKTLNPPLPQNECPNGPISARRQTIAYHLHCPNGWAPNDKLRCQICPKGHFLSNETCAPCPLGTFSPILVAQECQKCPIGTFTAREGSSKESDCLPFCSAGFYSSTGLAPCIACLPGTYQPNHGQTECRKCPNELDGIGKKAAKDEMECKNSISPLALSHSSFESIGKNCSNGTFLSFIGQNCEIPLDLCGAEFCLNGGICSFDRISGSKCSCKENFDGQRCEKQMGTNNVGQIQNSTKMLNNECLNGQFKENICECNTGFKLDIAKNECIPQELCEFSKPCQFDGKCKETLLNSFKCSCQNEYSGEFCHLPKQSCFDENFKCLNGGECAWHISPNESENFNSKCLCPSKFEGERCQIQRETQMAKCERENWCKKNGGKCKFVETEQNGQQIEGIVYCEYDNELEENNKLCGEDACKNGGTCVIGLNQTIKCACLDGFAGSNCENKINYCELEEICLNGGICQNTGQGLQYECICDENSKFIGKNCEKENGLLDINNICEPNPCFNDGKCLIQDRGYAFKCECLSGYSTLDNCKTLLDPCQQDAQYCNSAGECRILPNSKFPYCHCFPQYTGIRCESRRRSHFNIYFADPKSQANSPINQQIFSTQFKCAEALAEFSFCLWVNFGEIGSKIFNNNANNNGNMPAFAALRMQNGEILFQLHKKYVEIFVESGSQLIIPYGKNVEELSEQSWHHICLISSIGSEFKAIIQLHFDGSFTSVEGLEFKWDRAALYGDATCEIILGQNGDNKEKKSKEQLQENNAFIGQISLAELYYVALNEEELIEKSNNCQKWSHQNPIDSKPKISWTDFTSIDTFNSAQMEIFPGICANSNCQPGQFDEDCNGTKISKLSPIPIGCPKSKYIYVPNGKMRLTNVEWEDSLENMFQSAGPNPIVRFESNFRSGQTFGWGHFRVVYLAEDVAGNWATCEFDIVIAPDKCQEPIVDPQKYTLLQLNELDWEENSQASLRAQIQCQNDEELVFNNNARPPFYTCDRMGQWNRWEKFGTPFTLPSCSPTDTAMQEVEGDVHFSGNCTETDKYVDDVIHCVMNASNKMGGFCEKENCEGQLAVKTDCLDNVFSLNDGGIILLPSTGSIQSFSGDSKSLILGRRVLRQKRAKNADKQQTIRVQFDLNVNNTKRAVGPAIRDSMENWFGNDFKGEQIRLSCSDTFPQLHIGNNGQTPSNSEIMSSDEASTVQCATCAPGETWQNNERKMAMTTNTESVLNSDASGNCVKCPVDTYKPKEGVQPCTQCPDGRITGGITGCMHLAECFINCDPGTIYDWGMDQCRPCPRGQYMEYSGRLKCMACPTGKTTEGEGSTSAQQCSVHCPPGEMLDADEHCQPCKQGTFRAHDMDACKQCELGFTTRKDGAKGADGCDQIYCPPGFMRDPTMNTDEKHSQTEMEFTKICQICPIGYYQNEYGSTECIRCPTGFITAHAGAKSERECDQPWDGTCKPDEPNPCPDGMDCIQIHGSIFECHIVPVQNDVDEDETNRFKRLWIPIWLSLVSVLIFALLLLLALLNRKKWLLIFHRHFPKAALLCCKKLTVDNLSNSDFARNDEPPIGTSNVVVNVEEEGQPQLALEQIERPIETDSNVSEKAQRKMLKNLPIAIVRPNQNGSPINDERNKFRRKAHSESSSSASDPLNEIRSSLMEVMSAQEGLEPDDLDKNTKEIKSIRPKLTVQTQSLWSRRRTSSSSSSISTQRRSFAANKLVKEEQLSKNKTPTLYSGEKMLASALATDPIGRFVFLESGENANENNGRGISGLRRNQNNNNEKDGQKNESHEKVANSPKIRPEPRHTNLFNSTIRSSITGRTAKILPAANSGKPLSAKKEEMSKTMTKIPTVEQNKNLGAKSPQPPPCYDDDDDAFFS